MRFFDRYTGFFRRIKFFYVIHNLLNYRYLKKNKKLYKKFRLHRKVWQSISSKHFKHLPKSTTDYISSNEDWNEKGFVTIRNHFLDKLVDEINYEVNKALKSGAVDFNYTQKKILFAYEQIPILKKVIYDEGINKILEELTGEKVIPFQSINFLSGSEQKAHSDSVHMSTYPEGGLIAIWLALEDVDEENGTLFYYPGSHKLPYANNEMMGNSTGILLSENPNKNYEDYIDKEIAQSAFKKETFVAKKGDVLIWHANLVHGGLPHNNSGRTRKSMVVHYFLNNHLCYHELSQRPAIIKPIV